MTNSTTVNTDVELEFNPGKFFTKFSKEEVAEICTMISGRLRDKVTELTDLFQELRDTYPEFFCLVDFSLICSVTTEAFDDPIALAVQGTPNGIARSAQNIIKALQEINNDKEIG